MELLNVSDFSMTISSLIRFLLISFAGSSDDLNVPGLRTDDSDDNTEAHVIIKLATYQISLFLT